MTCVVHAITTIGQHPRGAGLHLRNLQWALRGVPHRIHVQTFAAWRLEERAPSQVPPVTYVTTDAADCMTFHPFWDAAGSYLEGLLPGAEAFLLIEQDILWTRPLTEAVETVRSTGAIYPGMESAYMAVFRPNGERIFPRIWEGGSLLPAARLADALAAGISLGNHPRRLRPGTTLYQRFQADLETHRTCRQSPGRGPLVPLVEPLADEAVDTLFEFSLYAFLQRWPCLSPPDNDQDYEAGAWMVHLRNPESVHRDFPEVYQDIRVLWKLPEWYRPRLNDCALMFLLAGVCEPCAAVAELLRSPAGLGLLRPKMLRLLRRAEEWMTPEEWQRFTWACRVVG